MNNLRITSEKSLMTPAALQEELPIGIQASEDIINTRSIVNKIMQGEDDRLLVIVGPCSIHDIDAALEYASLLKTAASHFSNELYLVMRVYFEKPRTTLGWKGLINDPLLDHTFDINNGLKIARKLLLDLNKLGIPAATEFLNPLLAPYFLDLITWGAIGARTTASQIHRELASGLPMPVGFKNSIDGNINIAVEAVKVASYSHSVVCMNPNGTPHIAHTKGNSQCHIILRGSQASSNYEAQHIEYAKEILEEARLPPFVMVDCSHGNSAKDYRLQHHVVHSLSGQLAQGSTPIRGVMLESHLIAGKQRSKLPLMYGQSITDGCISFQDTLVIFEELANAVILRGNKKPKIDKSI